MDHKFTIAIIVIVIVAAFILVMTIPLTKHVQGGTNKVTVFDGGSKIEHNGKLSVTFYKMKGCGPCIEFTKQVWDREEFKDMIHNKNGSYRIVTAQDEPDLIQSKDINAFPTIDIVRADGSSERVEGFTDLRTFLSKL